MTKTAMPEISIVLPVYNGERFLRQTLDSIFNQTYQDFELICVDDGSTDQTSQILQDYAKKFPHKVHVITERNAGPGVARNNGIKVAKGKYLAMLDADDLYESGFLDLMHARITDHQSDIVVCRSNKYITDENRYVATDWTINQELLPRQQPFAGAEIKQNVFEAFIGWSWDKLYRTEFVRKNQLHFQDLRSSEDALFVFMSIVRAKRISTVNQILVHHRSAAGSVSHTRESNWESCYKALLAMRDQLKDWELFSRFKRDFINYALNFTLWHLTTLTGEAYEQLFHKLKNDWWQELGIVRQAKDPTYFYNPWHYELYQQVMAGSPCSFQQFLRNTTERTLSLRDQELYDLHHSLTWRAGRIVMLPIRVMRRLKQKLLRQH